MHSLFKFKTTTGATTILWETCAPGHGKGPWDGIGAVIKRLLRLLETQNKVYNSGARDVFCALLEHFVADKVGSGVKIDAFVFHYILSQGEPPLGPGVANVWPAITRPSARPTVTSIVGIRSSFCFRVADGNVLAVRELSCRCRCCLEYRWTECKNADAGPWRRVAMTSSAASVLAATRTQRSASLSVISSQRHRLARGAAVGEIIAMQSADDSEGFSFWLARVESVAYQHADENSTDNHGRKFVRGGWYIEVRYYERFPTTSPSIFKLGSQVQKENAEGVIARNVPVEVQTFRRSARAAPASVPNQPAPVISLAAEQAAKLDDLPSL